MSATAIESLYVAPAWWPGGLTCALIAATVVLIIIIARQRAPMTRPTFGPRAALAPRAASAPKAVLAPPAPPAASATPDPHQAYLRLYSAVDVDPIITGQRYASADSMRPMYAQRVSHDDSQGLVEFSSSGSDGDLGVSVGPPGVTYDDGIPSEWALPSTPIRWYRPAQRDYYGQEGPTVYAEGIYQLSEPDHDPPQN